MKNPLPLQQPGEAARALDQLGRLGTREGQPDERARRVGREPARVLLVEAGEVTGVGVGPTSTDAGGPSMGSSGVTRRRTRPESR